MSESSRRTPGQWLNRRSINQRLNIQASAAIVLSVILMAVIGAGSYASLSMIRTDNRIAHQALSSALLEKDFASLERDVFRHALLRSEATREGYEGNIKDLSDSLATTRSELDPKDQRQVDDVKAKANAYVSTVDNVLKAGPTDEQGVSAIMNVGDSVDASIEAIRDPVIASAEKISADQENLAKLIFAVTLFIAALVGFSSFVLARMIRNAIARELGSISEAIGEILQGNLDVEIDHVDRQDDLGELARAAVQLRETSRAKLQSDTDMKEMASHVGECLKRMSEGDLTVSLPELSEGYAGLRNDFNNAIAQLRETMTTVADVAHSVKSGSTEISQASDSLAQRTERHAAELAHTAESVNHITTTLNDTADGAAQANRDVDDAMSEAITGGKVVAQAVDAMSNVEDSSVKIEQIIGVIDGIAFQTNLLALNAGVEAARAGSAGSGFAVVANEVRALAQRSADAAKDIKALIESTTTQVSSGAELVRKTGAVLERITTKIEGVTALVNQISSKAAEQSALLAQTNNSMGNMDQVTQQNAAMVEESTAAARILAQDADNLADLVSRFTLNGKAAQRLKSINDLSVISRSTAPLWRELRQG